jgi:hypothetical protein
MRAFGYGHQVETEHRIHTDMVVFRVVTRHRVHIGIRSLGQDTAPDSYWNDKVFRLRHSTGFILE